MEEVLHLAQKVAEEAEVYKVVVEETSVGFEANRLKHLSSRQGTSLALRLIKNGKFGFSVTNRLDSFNELVELAEEASQFGAKATFHMPQSRHYDDILLFDTNTERLPLEEMVKVGDGIIGRVLTHTPSLVMEGRIGKYVTTVHILNSSGTNLSYSKSAMSVMFEGNLVRGTDILFVEEMEVDCQPVLNGGAIASSLIEQLDNAREIASVPTKRLPVIFTPNAVASSLLLPLAQAFSGRNVFLGASPVGHRLGQQVFDGKLNVWDDATLALRPSSRPFDDEGVLSQRTALIENGVVANFYYDLQTAGLAKTLSTGNGSRVGGGLPAPSISAMIIDEGFTPFRDLVQDIPEGLVVDMLMGAEQGNTMGGDFNGNVLLGYKIEKGRLVGRVKDTMVSGNIYEALKDITLGKEYKWVGSSLRSPHIYFPNLAVSTKH